MNIMKHAKVKENHSTSKQFSYSKGDVSLNFSLRTDKKGQLEDFKQLLTKALEDVEGELK